MSRRLVDGQVPTIPPDATKGGRQPDLTPELAEKILNAIRMGGFIDSAAYLNGASYSTLRNWVLKAKEDPASIYGAFITSVQKAAAEYEFADLSIIHMHARGRPAEYVMEPVLDEKGQPFFDKQGKPLETLARDADGRPILKRAEIKSDWKAAEWRLSRRFPKHWARRDQVDSMIENDGVLQVENTKPESIEALTFEERVAIAARKFDEDI